MTNGLLKYRIPARFIHWIMGFLFLWVIPVGSLLVLIILRPICQMFNPPALNPVTSPTAQEMATNVTHIGFYALPLIISLTGYVWGKPADTE